MLAKETAGWAEPVRLLRLNLARAPSAPIRQRCWIGIPAAAGCIAVYALSPPPLGEALRWACLQDTPHASQRVGGRLAARRDRACGAAEAEGTGPPTCLRVWGWIGGQHGWAERRDPESHRRRLPCWKSAAASLAHLIVATGAASYTPLR